MMLEVQKALAGQLQSIQEFLGCKVRGTSIREIDREVSDAGLTTWFDTFCTLQWARNLEFPGESGWKRGDLRLDHAPRTISS